MKLEEIEEAKRKLQQKVQDLTDTNEAANTKVKFFLIKIFQIIFRLVVWKKHAINLLEILMMRKLMLNVLLLMLVL